MKEVKVGKGILHQVEETNEYSFKDYFRKDRSKYIKYLKNLFR